MYGDIIDAFVQSLRRSAVVTQNKIAVCVVASDEMGTVNTTLPAIAIWVEDSDDADIFIGGAIKDKINLKLAVMTNLNNYSWTTDNNMQMNLMSLSKKVRDAIEIAKSNGEFACLADKYDFMPLYRGFKTYQRIGMRKEFKEEVSIAELRYSSTVFNKELMDCVSQTEEVEKVIIADIDDETNKMTTTIPNAHGM